MRRKFLLLLMLSLVLLVTVAIPPHAEAACTGDQCGCGDYTLACIADCPTQNPAHQICVHSCNQEAIRCAIKCCEPQPLP